MIEWVLETHAHADHLSGAPYIKAKTGAKIGIGEHIKDVQRIFRPVFNATDLTTDGSDFDHLFKDGEHFRIGTLKQNRPLAAYWRRMARWSRTEREQGSQLEPNNPSNLIEVGPVGSSNDPRIAVGDMA